ncbi:MAG: hypothetical protein JWP96_2743 [Polaromonas sp.]|nr:hypothetical protein [Polaromonas sp.]
MRAYVTLLSTLNYLPGVIVLYESLKQVNFSYSFWVGISTNIPPHVDSELTNRGMHVIRLPAGMEISGSLKEKSGHWSNTFDKLHLFGLMNFSKLVYLDSDMMVLKNIDELFEKPHMSAVAAGNLVYADWKRLNSGLMVIEPEHQLPEKIAAKLQQAIQEAASAGIERIGDQDLINVYYPDWPDAELLHLDQGYNVFYSHLDNYIENHGYSLPGENDMKEELVRVVHFVGHNKPWMKWSNLKHFYSTLGKRHSTQWERKLFSAYSLFLEKV